MTLRVADLDRSLAFWQGRLGVPLKLRVAGLAELQSETVTLALCVGEPRPGTTALAWEVEDLDAACERLRSAGIECAPLPAPEGVDPAAWGRRASFADPDGHRLELACWA